MAIDFTLTEEEYKILKSNNHYTNRPLFYDIPLLKDADKFKLAQMVRSIRNSKLPLSDLNYILRILGRMADVEVKQLEEARNLPKEKDQHKCSTCDYNNYEECCVDPVTVPRSGSMVACHRWKISNWKETK